MNENPTLASVEAIKAYLIGLITAAAHDRGPKVQLTYVGGEFAKTTKTTFEKHLNALAQDGAVSIPFARRKIVPFLETYCQDQVTVERLPSGAFVAYLKDGIERVVPSTERSEARAALKFKRPVWAAFIRPISQGKRYLNLEQIGFTDQRDAPVVGTWKEIPAEYILGAASDTPIDGADLQTRIENWARAADVPLSMLVLSAPTPPSQSRPLNSLLDLIDSLPPNLAASWSIPATILKHLRNAR